MASQGDLNLPESDSEKMPSDVQKFTSDLIRAIPAHQEFSAQELFEKYSFLCDSQSCMIDLAYEEFCRRRERGEAVIPTAFAKKFPRIEQSLHRVIEFDQIIHQHPSYVENFPKEQWPSAGDEDQNFLLVELIGRGVLSRVFTAQDRSRGDRTVVAKICVRGEQEGALLGKLEHPSITNVHGVRRFGTHGLSVISMPYETRATLHHVLEELWDSKAKAEGELDGSHIAAIVANINSVDLQLSTKPSDPYLYQQTPVISLPFRILVAVWGAELAGALGFAHLKQIYHCDVKPGNILLLPTLRTQLMDFNLATSSHLESQVLGGTLPYMASEQLKNVVAASLSRDQLGENRPATDVFGLCATLWHVITGQPPFGVAIDEDNRVASANAFLDRQKAGVEAHAIELARERVSENMVQLLLKGMASEPSERFVDAWELEQEFRREVDESFARERLRKNHAARLVRRILIVSLVGIAAIGGLWYRSAVINDGYESQVTLAENLVREGQYQKARDVITKLPSEWKDDNVKYLDLYCRTLIEATPKGGSKELKEDQLLQLSEDWRRLSVSGQIKAAATLNVAFLRMQMLRLEEAEKIVATLPEESEFRDCRERVENGQRCFEESRKLFKLCSNDPGNQSLPVLKETVQQIFASRHFDLISSTPPLELTSLEAQFQVYVEVVYWKSLANEPSLQRLQFSKIQELVNNLVPARLSVGDLYSILNNLNCDRSLVETLQVPDQSGVHSSVFILPPSRVIQSD